MNEKFENLHSKDRFQDNRCLFDRETSKLTLLQHTQLLKEEKLLDIDQHPPHQRHLQHNQLHQPVMDLLFRNFTRIHFDHEIFK